MADDDARQGEYRETTLEYRNKLVDKDFDLATSQSTQLFTLSSAGVGLATTLSAQTPGARWCLVGAAFCFMVSIAVCLWALGAGRGEIREKIAELDSKLANLERTMGVAELAGDVGGAPAWHQRWTRTRQLNVGAFVGFGVGAGFLFVSRLMEVINVK